MGGDAQLSGREGKSLSMITRTVCDYASGKLFFIKTRKRVGGSADFECTYSLVIFAFEEKIDFGMGRSLAFEWSADQLFRRLGSGCEVIEGLAGQDGG